MTGPEHNSDDSAETCAVDGLLEELGRAGIGHDERFVGGVLARVKAERGLAAMRARRRRWFIAGGVAAAAGLTIGLLFVFPQGEAPSQGHQTEALALGLLALAMVIRRSPRRGTGDLSGPSLR